MMDDARAGRIRLGGCVISDDDYLSICTVRETAFDLRVGVDGPLSGDG